MSVQPPASDRRPAMAIGAMLVAVGLVFLVANQLEFDWGSVGWPIYVIIPGLALFAIALAVGGEAGAAFAIPGGIVTMTGIVLATQAGSGLYATWAYAWPVAAPGGVGIGLLAYGLVTGRRVLIRSGGIVTLVAAGLFLAFAFFFESVIGLSGDRFAGLDTLFAAGLVVLGAIVVLLGLVNRRDTPAV